MYLIIEEYYQRDHCFVSKTCRNLFFQEEMHFLSQPTILSCTISTAESSLSALARRMFQFVPRRPPLLSPKMVIFEKFNDRELKEIIVRWLVQVQDTIGSDEKVHFIIMKTL